MDNYIGTKEVAARPMNRADYNDHRGWTLHADENGADDGYLVEYLDGGEPNHPDHKGYISWSPKEQFENAYQANGKLSFGHALVALKAGKRIARSGWNGRGMFVTLNKGSSPTMHPHPSVEKIGGIPEAIFDLGDNGTVTRMPNFTIKNVDDSASVWVPSTGDALAEDWSVVA